MSRIKHLAVPTAALITAVVIAGCGGSAKDETTTAAATPPGSTTQTSTATTTPSTTTDTSTVKKGTGKGPKAFDDVTNTTGRALGKEVVMTAANGGKLTVTLTKLYDPVKSNTGFDKAPAGFRYVGIGVDAGYKGSTTDVVTALVVIGTDGSQFSNAQLADPDCGRNLVSLSLLGVELAKRGCVVALAPTGFISKLSNS